MTSPASWLSPDLLHALGWALINFLWQGATLAALAMLGMRCCRTPSARYGVGVGALALMLAVFGLTLLGGAPALPKMLSVSGGVLTALPGLMPWLVEFWLAGVLLLSVRFAGGLVLLEKRRRGPSVPASGQVLALCLEVQQRLGLTRAIRYLECGWLGVPAVIGCFRPVVLLPLTALTGLSEAQLRAVIAHELAHVRRWDFLVNLFQILAETLLFYHPAVWWLNRRIRAERELCCDDVAVAEIGNRIAYADALVDYARALTLMEEWKNAPGPAMAANHGILSERIFHIVGLPQARPGKTGLAGSLILLGASLAIACVAVTPGVSVAPRREIPRRIAAAQIPPVLDVPPAAMMRPQADAHVMPRRRLAVIRIMTAPSMAPVYLPPVMIADLADAPADAPAAPEPYGHSIVAQKLADLTVPVDQYPAPSLKILAPRTGLELSWSEGITYCKDFAAQTVTQGANKPMAVDEGVKQRLEFFYWRCMLRNGQMRMDGFEVSPRFMTAGAASAEHPVNASGGWSISFAALSSLTAMQAEARSCNFSQAGNALSGSCTGPAGSGAASGVIDGQQVRWAWTWDDGTSKAEVDFVGMVAPDGAMHGQSIVIADGGWIQMEAFTATSGMAANQVASRQ